MHLESNNICLNDICLYTKTGEVVSLIKNNLDNTTNVLINNKEFTVNSTDLITLTSYIEYIEERLNIILNKFVRIRKNAYKNMIKSKVFSRMEESTKDYLLNYISKDMTYSDMLLYDKDYILRSFHKSYVSDFDKFIHNYALNLLDDDLLDDDYYVGLYFYKYSKEAYNYILFCDKITINTKKFVRDCVTLIMQGIIKIDI